MMKRRENWLALFGVGLGALALIVALGGRLVTIAGSIEVPNRDQRMQRASEAMAVPGQRVAPRSDEAQGETEDGEDAERQVAPLSEDGRRRGTEDDEGDVEEGWSLAPAILAGGVLTSLFGLLAIVAGLAWLLRPRKRSSGERPYEALPSDGGTMRAQSSSDEPYTGHTTRL